MNADEIIRALRETVEHGNERPQTSVTNQCKDCYLCEIAADAIDELQDKLFDERNTSQALRYAANGDRTQQKWIPVTERPPKGDCFVYEANSKRVLFAYAEELDAPDWNITHWMPLPEPPKGE